ncbi:unnamed protein product [Gongylonema pulchrum]|uniref:Uncharacterized protein n=1 Tax=Gongylonema pulchrum TaxID=637853 RepID=A0A3P6TJV8_9BILA|nr:unnamed protein product [Gongylonema pulchrum]
MFLAASQGHVEMVRMLIAAGARQNIPDNLDQTPEQIAFDKKYEEVTDYFASLRSKNYVASNAKQKSKSLACIKVRCTIICEV